MMPPAAGDRHAAPAAAPAAGPAGGAGRKPVPGPGAAGAPRAAAEEMPKIRVHAIPPPPASVEDTGLSAGFLTELACKVLYQNGALSLSAVAERMALPVSVAGDVMEFLRKERMAEVKKGGDLPASTTFSMTDFGRERAREFLRQSEYAGPAPVPLGQYAEVTRKQTVRKGVVTRDAMSAAFRGVVLPPGLLDRLGPAMNSGRSIFLYGPAGTGKTFIAERLAAALTGHVFLPHAVAVDGQVVRIYDPVIHRRRDLGTWSDPERAALDPRVLPDRRWVLCERPVVVAGGELTLSMLDIRFDPVSRMYEAPLQVKANGGILLIDDLGRQQVRPFDLLNRWIVPLEKGRDFLSLSNGKKFEVPFDEIVVFSTNLSPGDLADEAFLRRIGYKIRIDHARLEDYIEIFRRECRRLGMEFRPEAVRQMVDVEHPARKVPLCACHPNDILSRVAEICRYEGRAPVLEVELLSRACRDYFAEP